MTPTTKQTSVLALAMAVAVFAAVANAHGEVGLEHEDDPFEQSRDCFEKVHYDFSRRISDDSQRELGTLMGSIADAEEKSVNPKEKGAMSKYFLRVLKRTEHEVMESKAFSPKDKSQMKTFLKHLRNCVSRPASM